MPSRSDARFPGLFLGSLGRGTRRFFHPGVLGVLVLGVSVFPVVVAMTFLVMFAMWQVEAFGIFKGMLLAANQGETKEESRNSEQAQRFHAPLFSPTDAALQPPTLP